ncbi:uncharacterized protein DSM5745_07321 [Aspergillus mulundensis]|uniref:Tudor domain-containing protein n=1 Tax=Aspergillus mulundensis TaxID=1810919 RepID=A0A3D8RKU5_9EURO|nr:Uncharacterized protein DSM5745_07321 [Aspergillus mulundensis]RDW74659.1 Uncharacterized protein DSM5745_07321 [Aspergillus mulundensis]
MSDVAALEAEVKEFKLQLETVQSSLQVDPDNTELQSLKAELEELINFTETSIAELKPAAPQPYTAPTRSKGSRDDYASKPSYRAPAVDQADDNSNSAPASFSVNEHVLARWVSGDNSFYPARITSITGSSSNPVYIVSFKSYGTVESLTAKDLKPISNSDSRKRKADGSPGSSNHSPVPQPPHASVISAAADINPALANQARKDPNKVGDGPGRPTKAARKVKANKELEAGKNKWKDFASKTKIGRKDSMFRTGEGVNARVGFTGSGQTMRKDPTRSRHVYQQGEEDNY